MAFTPAAPTRCHGASHPGVAADARRDGRGRSPGGDPHWPTPLRVAPHHYRGFCAGPYIQFYPVRPRLSAVPGCFVLAPARFRLGETAILKSAGFRRGVNSCPALPKFLGLGALRSRRTMGCFVPVLPYRTSARQCWALSLSIEGVHDSPIPPVAGGLSLSESSSTRTALRGSGDFSSGRRNPFSPHGAASRVSSSPCPWRRWSRGLLDGGRGAVAVSLAVCTLRLSSVLALFLAGVSFCPAARFSRRGPPAQPNLALFFPCSPRRAVCGLRRALASQRSARGLC